MLNDKTIETLPLFPSPLFTRVYDKGDLDNTIKFLDNCKLIDLCLKNKFLY